MTRNLAIAEEPSATVTRVTSRPIGLPALQSTLYETVMRRNFIYKDSRIFDDEYMFSYTLGFWPNFTTFSTLP